MHRNGVSNDKAPTSGIPSSSLSSTGTAPPVSLDEAIGLLKDRQDATSNLNNLLAKEMNDHKTCESYQAFRVRYLRALGKLHPVAYEESDEVDKNDPKAVQAFFKTLRKREKEKKQRYSQLKDAWLYYDSVAIDKPEVLSVEDQKTEKELDDIEEEIHAEWQDFAEEVILRTEEDDMDDEDKEQFDAWVLELKELKKDMKHLKMRKTERDDMRKRAEMRRIKDIVRARRSGVDSSDEAEFSDSDDNGSTEGGDSQSQMSKSTKLRKKRRERKSSSSRESKSSKEEKKSKKEKLRRRRDKESEDGVSGEDNSMELLEEVFPPHIARALREGRKVEPESKEIVTIFFSDIVGFTKISATISPLKVSQMLDRLYQKFDHLSREHDVYKVETIGDSWMGVTNLTKDQHDHAQRVAHFALDAIKAAQSTFIDEDNYNLGKLNLRVGFHSGPVVANVVGSRNPRYCLFGDTVNTASRMESHSQAGRIQCSDASATLLREAGGGLRLVSRGPIDVKGKGLMETFFVEDEFAEPSAANDLPPPPALMPAHETSSPRSRKEKENTAVPPNSASSESDEDTDQVGGMDWQRSNPGRKSSFHKLKFWRKNSDEQEDDTKKSSGLFGMFKSPGTRRSSLETTSSSESTSVQPTRRASVGSAPPAKLNAIGVPRSTPPPRVGRSFSNNTQGPNHNGTSANLHATATPRQRRSIGGVTGQTRTASPTKQRQSASPTKQRQSASPTKQRYSASPTKQRQSASPAKQRQPRLSRGDAQHRSSGCRSGVQGTPSTPKQRIGGSDGNQQTPKPERQRRPASPSKPPRRKSQSPANSNLPSAPTRSSSSGSSSRKEAQLPSFPASPARPETKKSSSTKPDGKTVSKTDPQQNSEPETINPLKTSTKTSLKVNKFLARSIESLRSTDKMAASGIINLLNEIYEMVKSSDDRRDEFGAGGGIPLFTSIVKRFEDDTELLEASFRLMSVLAKGDANRGQLAKEKSIVRVLKAMTTHSDVVGLQQWGCESLASFALSSEYQDQIVEHDGLDVIMATQKANTTQGEVQVSCFRALQNLARHHSENSFNIAANGGIWAIMEILQAKMFPLATVIDLHVEAFRAMAELARDNESNRDSLATAGGIPKLLGAMSCFTRSANLVEAGIDALHCMSIDHSQNCDTIVAYDGIKTVVKFMQQHKKSAGVHEKAIWLFTDLVENSSTAQFRIPDDCIPTIEQALEKFADQEEMVRSGKELLSQLDPARS